MEIARRSDSYDDATSFRHSASFVGNPLTTGDDVRVNFSSSFDSSGVTYAYDVKMSSDKDARYGLDAGYRHGIVDHYRN